MMQSPQTRLNRAERDLRRAEDRLDEVSAWQPGLITSSDDLARMREEAHDRVLGLRGRVSVRRAAVARAIQRRQTQ